MTDEDKINVTEAWVLDNKQMAEGTYQLILGNCHWGKISPGQFVCLPPLSAKSAMARPFSIFDYDQRAGKLYLLYKVVGENTRLMAELDGSKHIKVFGPLGQGLQPEKYHNRRVILVGGGIGIAPLYYFCMRFAKHNACQILYGTKTKAEMIDFFHYDYIDYKIKLGTEDNSRGCGDDAPRLLSRVLGDRKDRDILVITCGPNAMMRKVAEMCKQSEAECYVILERIMACGINSCKGCSIKTKSGMKRVCHDGPVFPAEEVIWDELS